MSLTDLDILTRPRGIGKRGEPVWDIALLFPFQGEWTEAVYLALEDNFNSHLIELVSGFIEVLPKPDVSHQRISRFLFQQLNGFVTARRLGQAFFAPLPVRLWENHLRVPDLVFLKTRRLKNRHRPPDGADLVMEVVGTGVGNRTRDLDTKRIEYAKAGIPEYWIIDPEDQTIVVLELGKKCYGVRGMFGPGERATSMLLAGFSVDVSAVFAAGEGQAGF